MHNGLSEADSSAFHPTMGPRTVLLVVAFIAASATAQSECPADQVSFEMVTGYVYTAPADMLDSQPGTLMLTDCIDTCRNNASCQSINYETGLCVLFSSNADSGGGELTPSQFPVFTIYVQKNCLLSASICDAAWSFERVMNHELAVDVRKRGPADTRQQCLELCLGESEFKCRSALYDSSTGDCRLLDQDRHTMAGLPAFAPYDGTDYLEINCNLDEPRRLCVYDRVMGRILKTVDSVYQAIASREDCEDLCNNAPFRCYSYDFNDTGDNVCRLSHHSAHTLTQIEEPYLAIEEAATYELSGCYNVTIDCRSADMTANIVTSSIFNGKIYAKGSPVTCVEDVSNQLEFSITMGYNDLECGVEREEPGVYTSELILQHHDRIVTSDDLGMSLTCQYDLSNKSVANAVDLTITGEIKPSLYEEATVDSPNVVMKVEDASTGEDTKTAVVGDPLKMVFEIIDQDSPYEIFVRDLVAVDGVTATELPLIDARGCPVDPTIMSQLRRNEIVNKTLEANFDAFRFPTSEVVQFRAMVTPCMPTCEPVDCDIRDYTGQTRTVESYGRKKRWLEDSSKTEVSLTRTKRNAEPEEVLVIKTLKIVDKIGRRGKNGQGERQPFRRPFDNSAGRGLEASVSQSVPSVDLAQLEVLDNGDNVFREDARCLDDTGLLAGGIIFIVFQILLLVIWLIIWKKKRQEHAKEVILPPEGASSADSLSYIYEAGIPRRLN